jgi:hypothetical protein
MLLRQSEKIETIGAFFTTVVKAVASTFFEEVGSKEGITSIIVDVNVVIKIPKQE